jgi:predicted DNA-binding transcriptional regulator YafY
LADGRPGRPKGGFTQHKRIDALREHLAQHPSGVTLHELAAVLNVSTRTVRRYLREVGRSTDLDPVQAKGGSVRRWRMHASEMPRKIALRRTQAYALLAARRIFEPMKGSAVFDEIDRALTDLLGIARRPGRGPNAGVADARLEERFLYLPFAPKNYQQKVDEFDDLYQCVSDLKPLTLRYRSAGKNTEEKITVHPYAMVLHKDSIYCVGYHVERAEIRTLVLDRMRDTEIANTERFTLPADFSIDEYFQGELGIWRSSQKHKVVIEFDAAAAEYVKMRMVHPSQKLANLQGGGVRLTMTIGNLTQAASWVLEWGARAKVHEPPELVQRVQEELAGALARYAPIKRTKKKSAT